MQPARSTVLCGLAVLATVFVLCLFEASDPDLGFHLATGRAILAEGRWLDRNLLSVVQPEHPWVLQQGIPAMLFEILFQAGGIAAVTLLKAAVVALTFGFVFLTGLRLSARPDWAAVATLVAAWSCAFRFVERPLIFSNLMLAVTAWALAGLSETDGAQRTRRLLVAGLALVAGTHLHAGAIFPYALVLLAAAGSLFVGPRPRRARAALLLAGLALAAFVLAGLTLALYHPYPWRVLEVPFRMGADSFLAEHLIEFRTPWRFPLALMKLYWVFGLGTILLVGLSLRRLPVVLVLPPLAFLALSLRHVRFCDAFAIVAAPVVARLLFDAVLRLQARFTDLTRGLGDIVLVLVVLLAPFDHFSLRDPGLRLSAEVFPEATLSWIERVGLRGPAFVSDGWAGPYLARFYPRERVYFFPAFDAFAPATYREYLDTRYGLPGWEATLARHGIELVLLKYTSPNERAFQAARPNLRQHLVADPAWALLYFDDQGEVFVRAAGVNATQAEARRIDGVDPDRVRLPGRDAQGFLDRLEALRARFPDGLPKSQRLELLQALANADRARAARDADQH